MSLVNRFLQTAANAASTSIRCSSKMHYLRLAIRLTHMSRLRYFGRNVTKKIGDQKMIFIFSSRLTSASAPL